MAIKFLGDDIGINYKVWWNFMQFHYQIANVMDFVTRARELRFHLAHLYTPQNLIN